MKKIEDLFRLTTADEMKKQVMISNYTRVASILRWHSALVNHVFAENTSFYPDDTSNTEYYTVLDLISDDPEMKRLLLHFGAKTYAEIKKEQQLLAEREEEKERAHRQAIKNRRQNGKAIVDQILGTN